MSKRIPYCVAPWMNSHVTAHGERSVCCATTKYFPYERLCDWWQSKELRELRLQMLDGKPPMDTCSSCIKNTRWKSLATMMNEHNPDVLENADINTNKEGYTSLMPTDFEIKHILCNLKCRHCYDRSSSSIRSACKKLNPDLVSPLGPIYEDEIKIKKSVNDIEWMSANIHKVHWTGGEPFMSPLLIPGLKKMIENKATHVTQVIITNAMFRQKNVEEAISLLQQFSRVVMIVSIDGMGEIGAYGRTGWDEETFKSNVEYLKSKFPRASFVANFVLHAISILGMYDTVKYCLDNEIKFQGQLISIEGPHYLDYNLIKPSVYKSEFKRCRTLIDSFQKHPMNELIDAFNENYFPRIISNDERAILEIACKLREQEGDYDRLLRGKLNLSQNDLNS